jgi:hypothetical protein
LAAAELSDEKLREQIGREVVDGYTRVQSLFEQLRVARVNLNSAGTDLATIVTELNQQQYALLHSVGDGAAQTVAIHPEFWSQTWSVV